MACTNVFFVKPQHAKNVKTILEQKQLLDKRFRMTSKLYDVSSTQSHEKLIAIPIVDGCYDWFQSIKDVSERLSSKESQNVVDWIHSMGTQTCPYSSSMLGNHNTLTHQSSGRNNIESTFTTVQRALLQSLLTYHEIDTIPESFVSSIKSLSFKTCPKKLEQIGDDHTLVIPPKAFQLTESSFRSFLETVQIPVPSSTEESKEDHEQTKTSLQKDEITAFLSILWKTLAHYHNRNCQRVVRRGEICPDSKVRESGHSIVWSSPTFHVKVDNHNNTFSSSPGWITITEQGIQQSFDLTKVMFSRGNITEKIRFGTTLVQKGDVVLDMYAGIGYYTLPALLASPSSSSCTSTKVAKDQPSCTHTMGNAKGNAKFVYACEWNPNAIQYLECNLRQNNVPDHQYQLLQGDCRTSLKAMQQSQTGLFCDNELSTELGYGVDRISLGLLPSSEGGWEMAVQCLRKNIGGWLHIHGNVEISERWNWSLWVCDTLFDLIQQFRVDGNDWYVICNHVERVKSFAPKVDHLVADIFVGPFHEFVNDPNMQLQSGDDYLDHFTSHQQKTAFVIDANGIAHVCPDHIEPPTCALRQEGILHQQWMR